MILVVGDEKQNQKCVLKLVTFDRVLLDSNKGNHIPDEVRILQALNGQHHTIELLGFKTYVDIKRCCLILPYVPYSGKVPTSYRELWHYLAQLLEVEIRYLFSTI